MRSMGRTEGAPYADWVWWPNTTHASRLLMLAEAHGVADQAVTILYSMCYERGENVSLRDTVARAAVEAGVPGGAQYIQSDQGMEELAEQLRSNNVDGKRVSSAPTFKVKGPAGSHSFSGAVDTEQWLSLLQQLASN